LTDGVTSLRWENGDDSKALAAGTTDGTLAIFRRQPGETQLRIQLAIKAHKPSKGPQNLNVTFFASYH
jgi:hypothetical protein